MSSQWNGVWAIDPLRDERWLDFVAQHPNSSVFHTRGWLQALQATYGYEPIACTTSRPTEDLTNAFLFCSVRSILTGNRLVSLPFSDHCEPLVEDAGEFRALCAHMESLRALEGLKYVEIRSANAVSNFDAGFSEVGRYYLHKLDLRPDLDVLYKHLHKDCIQRKIGRAEREGLEYETGRSESLLRRLYSLLQLTRVRHQLPPQPFEWFQNLMTYMGENASIRLASRGQQAVAGILTLCQGKTVVYKYGGSDASFNNLGGMPMLFWRLIKEAKETGAEELDFGRSDLDNPGLIAFKERWSAARSTLVTWRLPVVTTSAHRESFKMRYAKKVFAHMPAGVLTLVGRLMYRHIG